ncbi:hypothetical protein SCHPADRAFT_131126 [Schizopora paradoxa]|uniref:Uncharacterized protein n=1 Tax=Schizopora paradoxa TaxID=27342 RepID=A0A0H2S265_9AGAM|nr:hypothetical protein SCHPADRAFT_131126 [Schizopora paradoxa]
MHSLRAVYVSLPFLSFSLYYSHLKAHHLRDLAGARPPRLFIPCGLGLPFIIRRASLAEDGWHTPIVYVWSEGEGTPMVWLFL